MKGNDEIIEYAEVVEIDGEAPRTTLSYRVTGRVGSRASVLNPRAWSRPAILAGVAGLLVFFSSGLAAPLAIALGHVGLQRTAHSGQRGRLLAVLALVVGYGAIAIAIAIIALALSFSHPLGS